MIDQLAYSLGFFLGDGNLNSSCGKNVVRFFKPDYEPLERIQSEVQQAFGKLYAIAPQPGRVKGDYWRIQLSAREVFDFFAVNTRMRQELPIDLFQSTREVQMSTIAGLLDSDGFVSVVSRGGDRKNEYRCQMGFGNSNRQLVEQLIDLCRLVGIKANDMRVSEDLRGYKKSYGTTINITSAWKQGLTLTSARKQGKFAQAAAIIGASETMYTASQKEMKIESGLS